MDFLRTKFYTLIFICMEQTMSSIFLVFSIILIYPNRFRNSNKMQSNSMLLHWIFDYCCIWIAMYSVVPVCSNIIVILSFRIISFRFSFFRVIILWKSDWPMGWAGIVEPRFSQTKFGVIIRLIRIVSFKSEIKRLVLCTVLLTRMFVHHYHKWPPLDNLNAFKKCMH